MSKGNAIVEMACSGKPPRVIAAELGYHVGTVYHYISQARREGVEVPYYNGYGGPSSGSKAEAARAKAAKELAESDTHIAVPLRLKALLHQEAERLGKPPQELARDILEKGLLNGWARNA